jgi:hypothetical protein
VVAVCTDLQMRELHFLAIGQQTFYLATHRLLLNTAMCQLNARNKFLTYQIVLKLVATRHTRTPVLQIKWIKLTDP